MSLVRSSCGTASHNGIVSPSSELHLALEKSKTVFFLALPACEQRHLILLLDSVPYPMMKAYWDAGKFRLFEPPTRTIAPFPVMTDPSFAEFFNYSPLPAVE